MLTLLFLLLSELPEVSSSVPGVLEETVDSFWVEAALEPEGFGISPCSSCWVLGGEADPTELHGWGLRGRKRGLEPVRLLLLAKAHEQGQPGAGTAWSRDSPEQG